MNTRDSSALHLFIQALKFGQSFCNETRQTPKTLSRYLRINVQKKNTPTSRGERLYDVLIARPDAQADIWM